MIGAAGQASVRKFGTAQETSELSISDKVENSFSSIHSVSSDTAVYVPGLVGAEPVDMLISSIHSVSSDTAVYVPGLF